MNDFDNQEDSNCLKCGHCCEPFAMDDEFIEKFKLFFQRTPISMTRIPDLERTQLNTNDKKCVFLSPQNRCVVYKDRPEICRVYGTGKTENLQCARVSPDGNMRDVFDFLDIAEKQTNTSLWTDETKKCVFDEQDERARYIAKKRGKQFIHPDDRPLP